MTITIGGIDSSAATINLADLEPSSAFTINVVGPDAFSESTTFMTEEEELEPITLLVYGQSNSVGQFTNLQPTYPNTDLSIGAVVWNGTAWVTFADNPNQLPQQKGGSCWPWMVTTLIEALRCPVRIISMGIDGAAIADLTQGTSAYNAMKAACEAAGGVDLMLFWQGETNCYTDTQSEYQTALEAFAAGVFADLGCPVMPCVLQEFIGTPPAEHTADVQAAQRAAVNGTTILAGPDFSGWTCEDSPPAHFTSDAKAIRAGIAWGVALLENFY